MNTNPGFYNSLAENHHLIFKDWNASLEWQASIFGPILEGPHPATKLRILDCACGIGTQALGLAGRGHRLMATDLSAAAVARARREAAQRGLALSFGVADMRDLSTLGESGFDAVIAADNALPHLAQLELQQAAHSIAAKLKPGGVFLATIRDYDEAVRHHPAVLPPAFYMDGGRKRIVHQVWDWIDDRAFTFHLYITRETDAGWECSHYASQYHALLRTELTTILADAGFEDIQWLMPAETGFYQPLALARHAS